MPPWIAAGMVVAFVVSFLFVYNRSTENAHTDEHRNCPGHSDSGSSSSRFDDSNKERERYDTPPNFRQRRNDDEDCPICLEPIWYYPQRTLPCRHRLHSQCFIQLRQQSDSCPICRQAL